MTDITDWTKPVIVIFIESFMKGGKRAAHLLRNGEFVVSDLYTRIG